MSHATSFNEGARRILDQSLPVPLWAQLAEILRSGIEENIYGDQLPSEPELVEIYKVSRSTVREAIRYLRSEGYIESRQGKGTFVVSREHFESLTSHRFSLATRIADTGETEVAELISRQRARNTEMAERLGLETASFCVIERVRGSRLQRLALERAYFPGWLDITSIADAELVKGSMYQVIQEHFGLPVTSGVDEVSSSLAGSYEAQLLGVPEGSPLLTVERTAYSYHLLIEFRSTLLVPDRVRFVASWGR